jgi:hypothetical protein
MTLLKMKLPPAVLSCRPKKVVCDVLPTLLLLLGMLLYCAGCSSFLAGRSRETVEAPEAAAGVEAQALLAELSRQNASLKSFKGLGKIKLWQNGQVKIDERVAWVGSERNKLSIVLMISGYPAVKMTSDGKWFYYYEAGDGKPIYKKIPADEASLKHIISIPIQASDILDILAGRVPVHKYDSAELAEQEDGQGYILTLKRWWGEVVEKIYLDESRKRVRSVEYYSRTGSLTYRVRFEEMQLINGYQVPARLSITNGKDTDFQLDVYRYYTDVPVTASMFVLNPPN